MIQGGRGTLSKAIMKRIEASEGVKVIKDRGEITVYDMTFGSAAYEAWKSGCLKGGVEQPVLKESDVLFLPIPHYGVGPHIVPESEYAPVYVNATDALIAYAPLRKEAFAAVDEPEIPLDSQNCNLPPGGLQYNHFAMSTYKVMERIQSGVGLPAIAALPSDTCIVRLLIHYSNCMLSIVLRKL